MTDQEAKEELEAVYLRMLAKRDMAIWAKRMMHENTLSVPRSVRVYPPKSEESHKRLVRGIQT